jgi:hypothetical protein
MKRGVAIAALMLALAACERAPMPDPAPGSAPMEDAMAPSDVAASESAAAAPASLPGALPPPELRSPEAQDAEPVANDLGTRIVDGWVGEWRGPEGTSLKISKQQVGYEVTVTNLDGPRQFHGIAADEVLQFERDGKTETVRAGDGAATGMKWLAGKKDCLVVAPGEGYCRD